METSCRLTNLRLSTLRRQEPLEKKGRVGLQRWGSQTPAPCPAACPPQGLQLGKATRTKDDFCSRKLGKVCRLVGRGWISAEFSTSLSLGKGFLDDYAWLGQWSFESDRNSFHIVAKHHTFIHLLWNSKFMNPRLQWCFKSEDFVGKTSSGPLDLHGSCKLQTEPEARTKYRVLLHQIISSHRFLECSKHIWES